MDSESTRYGGVGFGLAISKYIIESYRGRIWVENTVGKGIYILVYDSSGG